MKIKIDKKTLLVFLLYPLLFLASEILYRVIFKLPVLGKLVESYFIFFIFTVLFYSARFLITKVTIFFIFVAGVLINNVHYEIYRDWINGINYLLMFKEGGEVQNAGLGMLDRILHPILYALFESLLFLTLIFIKPKTQRKGIADLIFWSSFLFLSAKAYLSTRDNATTNISHSRVKAHLYTVTLFVGKILPYDLLDLSDVKIFSQPKPKILNEPRFKNIIFILGESLTSKHIEAFGYYRETMPFLSGFKDRSDALLKETYSAGVLTAISVPALFNVVPRPNGIQHMIKGDTNIFKLAQEQGYETYFYSSQPESEMSLMNLLGKAWMKNQILPTQLGYAFNRGMNDHELLPLFEKIDLDHGKNFIVLSQRGSHMIYGEYLSEDEKKFKNNTPLDNYDSTLYNTDQFIERIYRYLKQRGKDDYILIYTSDHGQYVTKEIYNQATITNEDNYLVPTFIYTPKISVMEGTLLRNCERLFHQQLATFMLNILGFDMPISDCQSGVINHRTLAGDQGWLEVKAFEKPVLVLPERY